VRWFNEGNFFEAHEVWEEIWTECRDPSRLFYQGLIQAAVCLLHFSKRNTRGARKLYHSSRRYLEQFGPRHQGLDVVKLLDDMERCCGEVARSEETFPQARLDVRLLPKIHLSNPRPVGHPPHEPS
jgi:predicted metal-dependent hydrolase